MRNRFLLLTALLIVALAAIADGVVYTAAPHHATAARRQAQLREFTLVAAPLKWEIQPGLVVDGWGYNGQVPGPTLRVTEGDLVRIHLINNLPDATTIHWHGIDVPSNMDGVPGLSQEPVEPGESFTYEFTATNPGTRWYHSHTDTDAQIQLGLFGAFIIDPAQPEPVHFDREFTYILNEKALDFTPAVAMGEADILHRDAGNGRGGQLQYDLFLMNGRAGTAIDPLSIAPGERIRIRLINAGNLVHAMHLHGQSFKIIATDGNPVPPAAQLTKDTVNIAPGERFDLEVNGTNPGVWMFHCHINNHAANGMTTELAYDGYEPAVAGDTGHGSHGPSAPLPITSSEGAAAPPPEHAGDHSSTTPAAGAAVTPVASPAVTPLSSPAVTPATSPAVTPAATAAVTPEAGTTATPGTASGPPQSGTAATAGPSGSQIVMVDDHFQPSRITVAAGTTVTWMNNGSNLHTTTSYDGLWDSGTLPHGQTFSFTFSKSGTYRFFCRQHLLNGMSGVITVTDQ